LVIFTADTLCVKAQGSGNGSLIFKKLDDLPYILEWPATVTDGTTIYAINGYTPNGAESGRAYSRDALAFDPQSDKWVTLNQNAGAKIQSSAVYLPLNDHIYIFGGIILATNKIYQDVETLDLKTGEIKEMGIHSRTPVTYGYASEWKGLVYLYGGTEAGNHTTSSVYSFDPKTADFTKLANMP
jgi:N-acetylneuraminic acid mutarotase